MWAVRRSIAKGDAPITSSVMPYERRNTAREVDLILESMEERLFPPVGVCPTFAYSFRKWTTILTVCVLMVTVALATWRSILHQGWEHEEERTRFEAAAVDVANTLRRQVETSASSVYTLASMVEVDAGKFLDEHFEKIASTVLTKYRGISNFDIAPWAVVKKKVPLKGNEGAIGHAQLSDYRRIKNILNTIRANKMLLDGPLLLLQGGTAVIGRFPVFTRLSPEFVPDVKSWWPNWNHTCCNTTVPLPGYGAESLPGPPDSLGRPTFFWGLVEFVSILGDLVADLGLPKVQQHMTYQFRNRNKHPSMASDVFLTSPDAPPGTRLDRPVVVPILLPELNIEWEFAALPKGGWTGTSVLLIIAMMGAYGGFIVSFTTFMVMESKSLQIYDAKELLKKRAKDVRACFIKEDELK